MKKVHHSLVFLCMLATISFSQEKTVQITGTPSYSYLHRNYISTGFFNNGFSDYDINQSNSGLVYPKLTGKTAMFVSGFLWGTKIAGDEIPHVGGSVYRTGLQPGKILNSGLPWAQLTTEDPNAPNVRIYKVRRDIYPGGAFVDLSDEMLIESKSAFEIRQQYETDWVEWPATDGAPYEDVNMNGIYEPNFDIPGFAGADQTIWFVANDLNPTLTQFLYGTNPIGMEAQVTIWSYFQYETLNHVFFKKYKLINKSNTSFDSTYISMWADTDIGNSVDDFAGCDSTLNLGYAYNGSEYDNIYEFTSPAIGFTLLKGPSINPTTNLDMTAFYYFAAGDAILNDPTQGSAEGSVQFYNFMQGKVGQTGQTFIDPISGQPTTFALNGDPITQSGWIDGMNLPSGDRRIGISSGPFNMAPGDTQEVYLSEVLGIGDDRIESIKSLRFNSILSKELYNDNFNFTRSPLIPTPSLAIEQVDNNFNLSWDSDSSSVNAIENFSQDGFTFQGYNVYQLSSPLMFRNNGYRLAIYDIQDGVTTLPGTIMNPAGYPINGILYPGNDTGINREHSVTSDLINGTYFIPGKKYYFAVTAYGYNSSATANPNTIESILKIMEVTFEDSSVWANYGEVFGVIHSNGNGDATIQPTVIDPYQLTNHSYKIFFNNGLGDIEWNLRDITLSTDVLVNQTNFTGNYTSPIIDGLQIKITKASGFKLFTIVSNAGGPIIPPQAGAFGSGGFPTPEGSDPLSGVQQSTNSSRWLIHTADNGTRGSYESFISRTTRDGGNWPEIIPYDFELRFTATGGWAFAAYNTGTVSMQVPFELWNIGNGTPTDPSDDYRMVPWLVDDDASGTFNIPLPGTKASGTDDHSVSGGDNDPYTDWIYWMRPTDTTPGEAGYLSVEPLMQNQTYTGGNESEAMARMVLVNWNGGSAPPYNADLPETGTVFRIESSKPPIAGIDEFTFHSTIASVENANTPVSFSLAQNYPNPFNPSTTIFYSLPSNSFVQLKIFNILGQEITTLVNEEKPAGNYEVKFNALQLSSGIYFYRLQAGNFVNIKKMILLK